ncbi:MAG TPA: hypothetical protein ENJ82_04260, partial [Bacteroidetes bacterium]|nr:hypothetical protein [Bacteroidota bacterium]
MKNFTRFLNWNHLRGLFFSLILLAGLATPLSAQYRVGPCAGATHATLMDAYNAIAATGLTSNTTIEICAGLRVNQPIHLTAMAVSPGARLIIKGMTGNAADVIYRITNPYPSYALRLDGARSIDFKSMTFELAYHASRTRTNVVRANNAAGDNTFSNVHINAPTTLPMACPDNKCATAYLENVDGDYHFWNCKLNGGTVGIFAWQAPFSAGSSLHVYDSEFLFQTKKGIQMKASYHGTNAEIHRNSFTSSNNDDFTGLSCTANEVAFNASQNSFWLSNKVNVKGANLKSGNVSLKNNVFIVTGFTDLIGMWIHGQSEDVLLEDNRIFADPSGFAQAEGILFEGDFEEGTHFTRFVEIRRNNLTLKNTYAGNG